MNGTVLAHSTLSDEVVVSGKHLGKTFANGTVIALEDANFDIKKGSFISLVGPSGCGKSTLLRLIAGLIDQTSGELSVHGTPVTGPRPDIGMMFQKATLLE